MSSQSIFPTNLKNYIDLNTKFKRMEKLIDVWAIDYALEKLAPLVADGFDYDDISNFILVRFDEFVHGGRLDEVLEKEKELKKQVENLEKKV